MPPNSSQSSFIPKRGPARAKRRKPAKRTFIFSLVAYSLVFASLLASGASYLYKNYTTSLLQNEVSLLNAEIGTFSVGDLSIVSEFDLTLQRATDRINNTASVAAALDAIELAIAQPVQITSLSMERSGDEHILLVAEIAAQSFDAALFQRNLLGADQNLFTEVAIDDVSIVTSADDEPQAIDVSLTSQPVTFTVSLQMPIESLPYSGVQADAVSAPVSADNQITL
jgi:hypothetical protein